MVDVLVVSNYPEIAKSERLKNALQSASANVSAINWDLASPSKFDSYDGVVLSGSPTLFSEGGADSKYSKEIDAIRGASVPVRVTDSFRLRVTTSPAQYEVSPFTFNSK